MKIKALIVDDSRVMRNLVMKSLRETELAEFEFFEAEDGADALDTLSLQSVDIMYVDWNMPNMSGVQFVARVRGHEKNKRTPIIMVTSERGIGKVEDALDRAGADAYVTKPFTMEELKRQSEPFISKIATNRANPPAAAKSGGFFSKLMGG